MYLGLVDESSNSSNMKFFIGTQNAPKRRKISGPDSPPHNTDKMPSSPYGSLYCGNNYGYFGSKNETSPMGYRGYPPRDHGRGMISLRAYSPSYPPPYYDRHAPQSPYSQPPYLDFDRSPKYYQNQYCE